MRFSRCGPLVLLLALVLAILPGCSLLSTTSPADLETGIRATTAAVVAATFQVDSVRAKFKAADLAVVKGVIDAEILPAFNGQKPISVAAARILLTALDQYLTAKGSPPLGAITAEAIESVALLIRTKPPSEMMSPESLGIMRGFLSGLSAGLESAIASYPKAISSGSDLAPQLPEVRARVCLS